MDLIEFRNYCTGKIEVTEEFPFGPDTLVYKVAGKMFALTDINNFTSVNLKCDPEKAIDLRERYDFVKPGFHMNKNHWNTVEISWNVSDQLLKEWINESYNLVVNQLPKKDKIRIKNHHEKNT